MSSNIYATYNIDKSRLKRDYVSNPLKAGERPYKEDLEYLYLELNIRDKDLQIIFNTSYSSVRRYLQKYSLKKPKELIQQNKCATNIAKYGVPYISQNKEIREKIALTNIAKYGSKCSVNIEKSEQTKLLRYGNTRYTNRQKAKATNKRIHGDENYNNRNKAYETCLERYGTIFYTQTNEYKELYSNSNFVKQKQEKEHITKKKNGTEGVSIKEDKLFNILLTKFPDVKRQYRTDVYPYPCDFYIPSLDLYIEYQGEPGHGTEPYIGTPEQVKLANTWMQKSTEINWKGQKKTRYLTMYKRWTITDPNKRKIVKDNHLKWIEFFNEKEFMDWFNKQ
jgi:hypothetical protein